MKKQLAITIFVIGLISLGVGCYLSFNIEKEDDNKTNSKDNNDTSVIIKEEDIKEYSMYNKYKLTVYTKAIKDENTIEVTSEDTIDTESNAIYSSLTMMGTTIYTYYDLNNGLEYFSSDNTSWSKCENLNMKLPDLTSLITKVKSLEGVTKEKGKYTYTTDLVIGEDTYNNARIDVSFDEKGYLSKIEFDLSNNDDGYDKYTMIYEFNSINEVGNVIIPEDIVSGAVESDESHSTYYIS